MTQETDFKPDRIPPQSLDMERRVLASILYDAALLPKAVSCLVPDDFYTTQNQEIFRAMADTKSTEPEILLHSMNGSADDGMRALLLTLRTDTASAADITPFIKILKDLSARRALMHESEKTIAACMNPDCSLVGIIAPAMRIQREIFASDFGEQVFIPTWDNRPPATEPLIELSNVRILTRGNIALLTACAGAGKSSVMEAACSSILAPMNDALGLTTNAKNLLYIDSERSKADHHASWIRMARRAGIGEGAAVPAVVRWENIKAIENLSDRLQYLWSRLDAADVPELVFIDGIGDFVADPNDSDECTALVYRLAAVADVRNTGIMVSLHNNPAMNSEKARGVLGSELWRKAESVLIIEKTPGDDVRRITTDYALGKNRGGSDAISSFFKWDNEQKMHVSCGAPAEAKGKTVCEREKIMELVGTRSAWSYNEMKAAVMDLLGKSEGTAKSRIRDLIAIGKITKSDGGTYSLAEEKRPEIPDYVHN